MIPGGDHFGFRFGLYQQAHLIIKFKWINPIIITGKNPERKYDPLKFSVVKGMSLRVYLTAPSGPYPEGEDRISSQPTKRDISNGFDSSTTTQGTPLLGVCAHRIHLLPAHYGFHNGVHDMISAWPYIWHSMVR